MSNSVETTAFERGIKPLLELMMPTHAQEVIAFKADSSRRERIDELASKSTEGELTDSESDEYAGYVRANKFVAVLQRQARRFLAS